MLRWWRAGAAHAGSAIIQALPWSIDRGAPPEAYDGVRFIFVRSGRFTAHTESGEHQMRPGDVLVAAPNMRTRFETESPASGVSLLVDMQYLIDLVFWQHVPGLVERLDARALLEHAFPNPVILLRLSQDAQSVASAWLDRLLELTGGPPVPERFFAVQGSLSMLLDVLTPFFGPVALASSAPQNPGVAGFPTVALPAATMRALLDNDPVSAWPLSRLAQAVHMSPSRAHRLFSDAYGVTPLEYQSMLRARKMARLLTTTSWTVQDISVAVGWRDRSHGAEVFRRYANVSPSEYRRAPRGLMWRQTS